MHYPKFFAFPVLVLSMFTSVAGAQQLKNFLENKEVTFTWLGVDFTQTRLIGDAAANAADIVDRQFTGINQVVVNEPKKYDIAGAFRRDKVTTDISIVNKRNEAASRESLKSDNAADYDHLKPADITKLVKSYNFAGNKGLGVLLVMEAMNKTAKEAAMYVTVIDMDKKNVLMTERMSGKAKGFGFRNYWAFSIHDVLDDLHDDYNKLKEKYANAKDPVEEVPVISPVSKSTNKINTATREVKKVKKKG